RGGGAGGAGGWGAAGWLGVTVLARSSAGRFLACGTLPWISATAAVGLPAGTGSSGSSAPARARPAAPAKASAGTARRRSTPPAGPGASTSQASVLPARASTKVSSGAPPMAAQGAAGLPAWLIASLPHGKAYGHLARSASAATHQPATATGQARSDSSTRWPAQSSAKITASAMASAAHAYQATLISQDSRGTNRASPNSSPARRLDRRRRPCSASTSSAGPSGASGHAPTGGKAAVRASPPATAANSAQGSASTGSRGRPCSGGGRDPAGAGPARAAGSATGGLSG